MFRALLGSRITSSNINFLREAFPPPPDKSLLHTLFQSLFSAVGALIPIIV